MNMFIIINRILLITLLRISSEGQPNSPERAQVSTSQCDLRVWVYTPETDKGTWPFCKSGEELMLEKGYGEVHNKKN